MENDRVYLEDGSYKQYLADGSFFTVQAGEAPPSPREDSRSPSSSPSPREAGRDATGQESRYAAWRRREDYSDDEGPPAEPQDPAVVEAARLAAQKLQDLASAQDKEKLDAAIEKQQKQQKREEQLMRAAFIGNPVREKQSKKRKEAQLEEERLAALLKEVESEAATPGPRPEPAVPMFATQAQIIAQQMAAQSMAAAVASRPSQTYILPTMEAPRIACNMVGGPAAAPAAVPAAVPDSVGGSVPSAASKDTGAASQPDGNSNDVAQRSADTVQDQAKETQEDGDKKVVGDARPGERRLPGEGEHQILLPGERRPPREEPRDRRQDAPLQFKNDRQGDDAGRGQRRRGRSRDGQTRHDDDFQGGDRRPRRRPHDDEYDPEGGHRGRRRSGGDAGYALDDRGGKRRYSERDDADPGQYERRRSGKHRHRYDEVPDDEDYEPEVPAGKHRHRRGGRTRLDDEEGLPQSRKTRPNSASRSIQRPARKAKNEDGTGVQSRSSSPSEEKPSKFSRGGFDKKEVPTDHAAVEAMRIAVATTPAGTGRSVIGSVAGATGVAGNPIGQTPMMAPNQTPGGQQMPPGFAQYMTPGGQQLPPGTFPGQFPNMFPAPNNPFAGRQRPVFPGPMLRGDWTCPGCGDHVFAKNYCCRVCNTPRPSYAT